MTTEKSQPKQTESKPVVAAEPNTGNLKPREIGGQTGPEPTRFGDWEKNGRCSDF